MKNSIYFLILVLLISCNKNDVESTTQNINFKQEMRNFVIGISQYAKKRNSNFVIIPQNGIELVTNDGTSSGIPSIPYLNAIDGNGQEDLFYGYNNDIEATPPDKTVYLKSFLAISKNSGNTILTTDYCSSIDKMTNSYAINKENGYVSFAANKRNLNNVPTFPTPINNENANKISTLSQAKNFLYLLNLENYNSKLDFINAVKNTNYDVLITDLYFSDGTPFSSSEINALKIKANGGKRIVISYMSIGEAEDYRYYWQTSWSENKPVWLDALNPNWPGNYKVKYWNSDWQKIIYGNDYSYLKKILDANFDGVYLDIIDAFEYYEQ